MRLYDVLQPIAEYVNRAKRREVLTATGNVRAINSKAINICSVNLKPNREYLITGSVDLSINLDSSKVMNASLTLGGNSQMIGRYTTRTSPVYGGGCVVSVYIKTGEKPDVITLSSYGSSTGTYYFRGEMFAVEL